MPIRVRGAAHGSDASWYCRAQGRAQDRIRCGKHARRQCSSGKPVLAPATTAGVVAVGLDAIWGINSLCTSVATCPFSRYETMSLLTENVECDCFGIDE